MRDVKRAEAEETISERLFPRMIDNGYTGSRIALWVLGFIITIRAIQSIAIIVNGYSIAQSADGIPLQAYPAAAAQTIVAIFALSSLNRLIISMIGTIVLIRYRRAVPLMFVVIALTYLGTQLITQFLPFARIGTPPGVIMNGVLMSLTIVGFVLSLWGRRGPGTEAQAS